MASLEEACEWLKRSPFQDTEVEMRRVFEDEDFGDNLHARDAGGRSSMQ